MTSVQWPTGKEVLALLDGEPGFAAWVKERMRLHGDEGEEQADTMMRTPLGWEEPFYLERLRDSLRLADEPGREKRLADRSFLDLTLVLELFEEWTRKENPPPHPLDDQPTMQRAVALFRHWQARRRT